SYVLLRLARETKVSTLQHLSAPSSRRTPTATAITSSPKCSAGGRCCGLRGRLGEGRHLRRGGITTPSDSGLRRPHSCGCAGCQRPDHHLLFDRIRTGASPLPPSRRGRQGFIPALKIGHPAWAASAWQRSGLRKTIRELEALYALPGLDICGVFQHFAVADSVEPDDERYTDEQHALFAQVVERLRADGCPRSARYIAPIPSRASCATPSGGTT
ncbi:MAG: alanine racemase, partial [Faecalibacterium prausnitzii]